MKENKRKCFKCGISPSDDPHITLHRFPRPGRTNSLRCELWAKYCFPRGLWHSPEFQTKLHAEHRMLCNRHFKKASFIDNAQTRLFKSAVPNEECDKMLTSPVQDIAGPSTILQPTPGTSKMSQPCTILEATPGTSKMSQPSTILESIPGTSKMSQPLLENVNLINTNKAKARLFTGVPVPQQGGSLIDSENEPQINLDKQLEPSAVQKSTKPDLTKKNKYLYEKCKKHMRKVHRLQKTINTLKNKSFINKICKNDSVNSLMKSKISPTFALLLQGEMRNFKKTGKARRWDTDSKIVALRLFKRSPTCYKLLRRMICLPAPSTLKSLLNQFQLSVGINDQIFKVLKKKTMKNETPSENEYVLMFDEMSIKKHLFYNEKQDLIEGFQDHAAQGRTPQVASYALVFMIAGIRKKVKQPVAFYFSGGSVTADRLAVLLKEVLHHCFNAGLKISATVCDLDGVNKRALSILGASVERPYIEMENQEVVTLFDTPHLLKCFRNLFMKYDIECPMSIGSRSGTGIAKWSHIKKFYELDNSNPNFVFAPCLKEEHLEPNTKQKMKVKLAAQVLSHSVAAGMYAKISQGELSTEATTTANVIAKMDKLFDSVNAYTPDRRRGKPLATNMQNNTMHIQYFHEMKEFFKNIKFLGCRRTPPSQEGWVWTLNGLERVWRNLTNKHKDIKSLATRRLQQDPLENLFGCIRGNCGANTNPTAGQFVAGLKTAILSNLSHIVVGNCEIDENDVLISNYKTLLTPATDICIANVIETEQNIHYTFEEAIKEDSGETQACAYVCGFIIKNNPNNKCQLCKRIFVSEAQLAEHIFIDFKEYDDLKKSLIYASKQFIACVESGATIMNNYLENEAYKKYIKKNVKDILTESIDFSFLNNCADHYESNISYLIKSIFFICIKRFCVLRNRQFTEESSKSALRKKLTFLNTNEFKCCSRSLGVTLVLNSIQKVFDLKGYRKSCFLFFKLLTY